MGTAAIVRINEMKKNEQLVYTYEDSEVVVTATLAAPDAVPDEAEFRVTRVTPQTAGYNYDVYMQALNNNAEMISPDNSANGQESDVYTEKNTLLYDIAFLVDKTDENGNVIPGEKEEYQPTEGAVNISFDFKKSQLTQEVEAEKAEEIAVVHLPLDEATKESVDTTADATDISAGNINVEVVSEAEVQLETEAADFDLNNFSLVAFVNVNGQELNPGTLQNYWSILGNAIYYGVTANTINKDAHMDTNFATKYFTGSGNVTAGAYTGNNGDANNGGVYVIADMSSDSSLKIDGKNSDVWCTDAIKDRLSLEVDGKGQKTIFAKGALEVYVDRLIASVSKVSASMADEVSYQVKNQNEVMNQAEIDISERPEGTYYIDGDWLNDISEGALRIKKKSDQTIVFNYKGTSVNLKRFEIWDTDRESGYMQSTTSSASADQYARTVVFNMPNATDVTFASGMFGIFLAPKATVHGLGGTSSGWLVVDTLDKNGSEWHCVWSDMPDSSHIPVPAQLTAIKTVNGDRPGDDEKFRFKLEIYNKEWRKWAQVEILPNKGNFVTFTSMTFRADGQYYYRISEYGEVDGYIKDDTVYIAVITVSSDSQISGDTTITSYKIDSVKYYRASDLEEVTEDNLVPAAAFDNTRQEEEKIETSVCKEWDDADNQDGKRPQSILVQLYANGQKLGEPVVLNEGNGWSYGWSDLPVKQDGQTVVYSLKEVGRIPGYESTVTGDVQTGFVITNSHTPELTNISGEKIWDDGNNQDGKRPESITVNLFANGEKIDSKAVKADAEGNWKYSFKNLPKYANGQLISYTVTDDAVPEYTTEISGTTITNKYQPGKTSISVVKAWEDGNNQDGLRPTDIKVQLYADGTPEGEEITLNAGNQWSYTWSGLDEMKSGQKISYTVKEAGKVTGYDTVISGEAKTGYVITNSHTPELTKISGEKIWDDGNNQDGKRPESITVNLFANGEKIDSKAVKADAEGNWKYSFKNLPKYADGQLISYTVTEDVVPEYTTEISGTTIINKYQPGKTSISVIKAWEDGNNQDGLRPTDIKVQLYADGSKQGEEITLNAGNQWSYTWSDLDEMKSGQKIVYTVEEVGKIVGYDTVISGEAKTGYVITNSHTPELTNISGEKVWDDGDNQDGKRPESITVNLFANGEKIDSKAVKADAEGNWKYSFKNLPKYANGQLISYTVTEDAVPEYTTEISGTTIINKYQPGKTSISVIKAWEDGNNQDGLRPTDIKVQLYADGSKQGEEVTLNAGNQWSYTWSGLNEMKSGQKISYTVKEAGKVTGYDTVISGEAKTGYVITNSHTPELTKISGEKIWDDGGNQDGKRPESITVNLLANGQKTDSKVVKADKEGNWSYTFQNLPKYANGEPIIYTVTEDTVTDYTTEVTGTTITNKYQPGKTSISVTKEWEDFNDHNGIRPADIKVQLYADGEAQGEEITLNAENQWTHIWTDLDERKAGELIDYTVKETENTDNYETTISGDAHTGYIITNTLKTGNLELEKLITGDLSDEKLTAEEKEALTFTITGPYDYQETVYYSDFTDGKYLLSSLPLGEYQVIEANAKIPGYVLTADYSVEEGTTEILHNETATVTITNNYETTSVKISKVDITSHEELEGAHLQIIDQEGNIVDEWDSTKTAHETTGLRTGETYILRETVAPDDYNITNDTTFELNEDGTINTEKTTTTIKDGILLVEDTMKEYSDADLTVTKHLTTNEGEEIKAVDQTFYVALYADEDCTERVSDIKPLVFQNASVSSVTFTKLEKDHTYYVGECDEEGTSYLANVTADGTLYTVEFHDGNVVEIDNPDGSKAIYFDNQFEEIPDNFYRDGKLIITKKLLRADGKAKNSSQTFYAGIFADEEYTQFAEEAEEKIVALDLAGNSKVSRSVTIALPNEGNVTLYVTEVDSAGKPVDGATGFKYEISVENAEITLNQENYQETVEITNKETTPTPTPKPSSTPTPTVTPAIPTSNRTQKTPGSFTGTSTRTAVKTGDTTPIDGFIALLAAAAVVTAAGVYFKRRRKAK